jgi:hypothetical protein
MTMPHPDTVDDVEASALVIEAEMAIEICRAVSGSTRMCAVRPSS